VYISIMSRKMVSIQEAAKFLGVCPQTLRRWECEGRLLPDERTPGGRRRYDLARLRPELLIITVFNARLYGNRSRKNQKLIEGVRAAVEAAQC
jgi:DNA-binding transcriptional MerR regulator